MIPALPVVVVPPVAPGTVRLVFVGDTGRVPDGDDCSFRADGSVTAGCHASVDQLASLRGAIRAEHADAVYALGDLAYWRVPACRVPRGAAHEKLAATVGAYFADLGAPVFVVLGNHDKAQHAVGARHVACLRAFADQVDALALPAEQYVVDHGVARVVVIDSNRRRTLPTAELRGRLDTDPGWVVVAAHHDLRVAFDKDDPYSRTELAAGAWLRDVGAVPDLWANGHAHLLQLGVYDTTRLDGGGPDVQTETRVPALTSGAGSKVRAAPSCGGAAEADDAASCATPDPRGMPVFSRSTLGYAVVELTAGEMTVALVDAQGRRLYRWRRTPEDPVGRSLPAESALPAE